VKTTCFFLVAILAGLAVLSCGERKQERQQPRSTKLALQEGYPPSVIEVLQGHHAAVLYAMRNWNQSQVQSVIVVSKTWDPRKTVTVAFEGGTPALRSQIVQAIKPWTDSSNLHLDFGPNSSSGAYREWANSDTSFSADVRIAFGSGGYWSMVGNDSVNPALSRPNQPSMNFEGFTSELPSDWQGTVLHEFGHAVGFQHEHQSPASPCDSDFRWNDDVGYIQTKDIYGQFVPDPEGRNPGIYTVLGGPPNNWSRDQIDFNLKQLPNSVDLRLSAFDKDSIMKYYFPGWMFNNGDRSACWSKENLSLSAEDQRAALQTYPRDAAQIQNAVNEQMKVFQNLFDLSELPSQLRSQYKSKIESLKNDHQ
jgi:hypothetical protein